MPDRGREEQVHQSEKIRDADYLGRSLAKKKNRT